MALAYIGVIVTYSDGVMIHIREGTAAWYIILIVCFIALIKGLVNIHTFVRRRIRCVHLNILRQKRKKLRQNAKPKPRN